MAFSEYLLFSRGVRPADVTESLLDPMRRSGFSDDALAGARSRLQDEDRLLAAVLAYEDGQTEGASPVVAELAQAREAIRAQGVRRSADIVSIPGRA